MLQTRKPSRKPRRKAPSEQWLLAETLPSEFDAQLAAHDYAHEGWYFRIKRTSDSTWSVFVRWGRRNRPQCCRPTKRTYVSEAPAGGYAGNRSQGLRPTTMRLVS